MGKGSRVKKSRRNDQVSRRQQSAIDITERTVEVESGPIPPAAAMARYEEVLPGSADRILTMAEEQQAYSHDYATSALQHQTAFETRGQFFAGILLILLVGCGTYLLATGSLGAGLYLTTPAPLWLLLSGVVRWLSRRKPSS